MSCCTPDGTCSTSTGDAATAVADATVTAYRVSGMTCGHCKTAITKSVGELGEVLAVDVDVDAGLVTVTTKNASNDAEIAAAVDDAGYELTGRA
ncbi:heavy-metal-associated domain-containing protein [Streptomyces sp. NPDC005047]